MRSFILDFIKLTVPEYIPVGITAMFVGFVYSISPSFSVLNMFLSIICIIAIIAGYNSFNSIADREIDRINKPHRPLAIRDSHTVYISLFFFVIAIAIGNYINPVFFSIILIAIAISVLYSFPKIHFKRRFLLGTISTTLLYTVLFPLGGWAIAPSNPPPTYLLVYLFIFGLGIATLKDFEDIVGDSVYGVRTPLSYFGYSNTIKLIAAIFTVSLIFLIFSIEFGHILPKYFYLIPFTALAFANLYLLNENRNTKQGGKAFIFGMAILMGVEICISIIYFL